MEEADKGLYDVVGIITIIWGRLESWTRRWDGGGVTDMGSRKVRKGGGLKWKHGSKEARKHGSMEKQVKHFFELGLFFKQLLDCSHPTVEHSRHNSCSRLHAYILRSPPLSFLVHPCPVRVSEGIFPSFLMTTLLSNLSQTFNGSSDLLNWDTPLLPPEVHTSKDDDSLTIKPEPNTKEDATFLRLLVDDVATPLAGNAISMEADVKVTVSISSVKGDTQLGGLMVKTNGIKLSISVGVDEFGEVSIVTTLTKRSSKDGTKIQCSGEEQDEDRTFHTWSQGYTPNPLEISKSSKRQIVKVPPTFTANTINRGGDIEVSMANASAGDDSLAVNFPPPPPPPPLSEMKSAKDNGVVAATLKVDVNRSSGVVFFSVREINSNKAFVTLRKLKVNVDAARQQVETKKGEQTNNIDRFTSSGAPLTSIQPTVFKVKRNEEGTFTMRMGPTTTVSSSGTKEKEETTDSVPEIILQPKMPLRVGVFATNTSGLKDNDMSVKYTNFTATSSG